MLELDLEPIKEAVDAYRQLRDIYNKLKQSENPPPLATLNNTIADLEQWILSELRAQIKRWLEEG